MRTNGTLSFLKGSGAAEYDDNGARIPTSPDWSAPVRCSVKATKHSNTGKYEDGKFLISSYEILIEMQEFDAKQIKLTQYGKELGEFEVQHIEPLTTVGRVKITV